jgi:SEC-C motif-containing protein
MNCPCQFGLAQTGQTYDRCCGRFITHRELPENATQLMRSRYSAYVLEDRDYLLTTWHADFRPSLLQFDSGIRWIGLEIITSHQQGAKAVVEFEARLLAAGEVSSMHERSDFVMHQGQWQYTHGEQLAARTPSWRPARNQVCPCGSGLKFKRCCGAA